jgi:hypothetical protein
MGELEEIHKRELRKSKIENAFVFIVYHAFLIGVGIAIGYGLSKVL